MFSHCWHAAVAAAVAPIAGSSSGSGDLCLFWIRVRVGSGGWPEPAAVACCTRVCSCVLRMCAMQAVFVEARWWLLLWRDLVVMGVELVVVNTGL